MKVYDDFAHIPKNPTQAAALYGSLIFGCLLIVARDDRAHVLAQDSRAEGAYPAAIQQEPSAPPRPSQQAAAPGPPPFPEALREKILSTLTELETEIRKREFTTYSSVPPDHFIRTTVKSLVEDLSKVPQREEASLLCASNVVLMLYNNSESAFAREGFVTLLTRLCEISPRTMKELSLWLLYGEDEVNTNFVFFLTSSKNTMFLSRSRLYKPVSSILANWMIALPGRCEKEANLPHYSQQT